MSSPGWIANVLLPLLSALLKSLTLSQISHTISQVGILLPSPFTEVIKKKCTAHLYALWHIGLPPLKLQIQAVFQDEIS